MVYESPSCDELNSAEYEAWYDEMMRDLREPSQFERRPDINF
jgi:hypothetical protein